MAFFLSGTQYLGRHPVIKQSVKTFFNSRKLAAPRASKGIGLLLSVTAALGMSSAHAVLTDSLTIGSPKALSLGHAVTADPPGIDSIHFNPAGLVRIPGRKLHTKVVAGAFGIELKFGEHTESREAFIEEWKRTDNLPDGAFDDSVANSTSTTEGASLMLPFFGMTDIPVTIAPIGGATYSPPGSRFTIGTNVYMPLGVGFFRDEDDPGRYMGERLGFSLITYFSPSIAYRLTDSLSVGATVTFNYAAVGLDLAFREPNAFFKFLDEVGGECTGDPTQPKPFDRDENGNITQIEIGNFAALCGGKVGLYDDLGYLSFEVENMLTLGMNIGFLWEPTPWFTAGLVYQAPIDMEMEGDYVWRNTDAWQAFGSVLFRDANIVLARQLLEAVGLALPTGDQFSRGVAKLEMEMPEHYALGVSVQVLPRLKVNMDYKFTGWSSWQGIPIKFENPIDFMTLAEYLQPEAATRTSLTFPLGLEDGWNWALGFEYQYNDRLALRFGIEDRPTSIPKEARSPLLPMDSGKLLAAGFSYDLESGAQIEFGVGFFSSSVHMPGNTSRLGNSENPNLVIYNPYSGRDITADLSATLFDFSYVQDF